MELCFDNKLLNTYKEISHQIKRVQESAESVVPDVNDDIGRIASVQTSVLLKSKDVAGHNVIVAGEAQATIIYITEGESGVSFIRLAKSFSIEYEATEADADTIAQINLRIVNYEARVLNPRKVSVTFEIAGELSCFSREQIIAECTLPADADAHLHAKFETSEISTINAVCEKTFAVSEQFPFPLGKPSPTQLMSQKVDFSVTDAQIIGSKVIIKANVNIALCYLSADANYPVKTEFNTPFSQIVDIGVEEMDFCTAIIQLTSAYFEIIDTISGERALDTELHAVIELVSRRRTVVSYISDVYSNVMPTTCRFKSMSYSVASDTRRIKLGADEKLLIADDCIDVLSVLASMSQFELKQGAIAAGVTLDIVYKTASGGLSSARRLISLENDGEIYNARLISSRIDDVYLRPDGNTIDCHLSLDFAYQNSSTIELTSVEAVELNDEERYDFASLASVTLVRTEGESMWELAKVYHSSVEMISAMNETDEDGSGRLIMIPKCI